MNKLTKEQAWQLLSAYTETPALQKHALQVAAAMEHFGRMAGEDPEIWWAAGLLHDLDYEKYPEEHCHKARQLMEQHGVDPLYIRAMECHGYGQCTDTRPESLLEKTLFTVDELTGLINAGLPGAPLQKRAGPGSQVGEKEAEGQDICRRGQPGCDPPGRRDAGHPSG